MIKYVPNTLTIIRFLLIPFIVVFVLQGNFIVGIALLISSALSDVIDGIVARRFNLVSNFGKLIDPLADKTTQIALIIALYMQGVVPPWIVFIVTIKESVMIVVAIYLYVRNIVVYSKWYGKLATVLFYIAVAVSLIIMYFNAHLDLELPARFPADFDLYIFYLVIFFMVFALIMYMKAFNIQKYFKKKD